MSQTFKPAPPGVVAIIWTLGFIGVFAFFAVRVVLTASAERSPDVYDVAGALILLGCIIYGWARSTRVYRVSEGELNIDRAGMKDVSVPLEMVKSVEANGDVGSFFNTGMLGSGGLFGWGGKARVRKTMDVDLLEAYVYGSNPKKSVVFSLDGGQEYNSYPCRPAGLRGCYTESKRSAIIYIYKHTLQPFEEEAQARMNGISESPAGVTIKIYVAPRSSANSVIGVHNGEIKVAITAPPVDGAANKALMEFIAKKLSVSKSAVSLVAGEASRHKVVAVAGVDAQTALRKLLEG